MKLKKESQLIFSLANMKVQCVSRMRKNRMSNIADCYFNIISNSNSGTQVRTMQMNSIYVKLCYNQDSYMHSLLRFSFSYISKQHRRLSSR